MSGFTSEALEKKLLDLNNSQQSIQTLSLWLIHHRKHSKSIVVTWYKELKKARQSRKLTFMYLANDVIQNSRKKGPEFAKEFATVLKAGFENVTKDADEKTWHGMKRILAVWSERNIYDSKQVHEFTAAIGHRKNSENKESISVEPITKVNASNKIDEVKVKVENKEKTQNAKELSSKKRKVTTQNNTATDKAESKKSKDNNVCVKIPLKEKTSPRVNLFNNGNNLIDSEELIKSLSELENSASSDAAVREKIASLPPEVSDASLLDKICDKAAAEELSKQCDEACSLLAMYNTRLSQELEDRKRISNMLSSFIKEQKEILANREHELEEHKETLRRVTNVRNELIAHLQNLPDLSMLPSVTGGLAPLPSAGDLFNVAALRNAYVASSGSTSSASPADYETVSGTPNST